MCSRVQTELDTNHRDATLQVKEWIQNSASSTMAVSLTVELADATGKPVVTPLKIQPSFGIEPVSLRLRSGLRAG